MSDPQTGKCLMSLRACFRVDGLIKSGCGEKPQSLCSPSFRIQGHGGTRIVLSGPGGRINAGLSGRMSPLRKTRRFLLFETGLPAGTGRPSPASGKYAAIRSWPGALKGQINLWVYLLFFHTYLFCIIINSDRRCLNHYVFPGFDVLT